MEQEAARHTLRRLNKMLDKGKIPADTLLLLTLPPRQRREYPDRFHDDRSGTPLPDCTVRTGHITGQTTVRHTPNAPTDRLKQKENHNQEARLRPTEPLRRPETGKPIMRFRQTPQRRGTGPCSKTGKPREPKLRQNLRPRLPPGQIQPKRYSHRPLSAQPFPGERHPNPRNRPRSGSDNGMETAVLSAS